MQTCKKPRNFSALKFHGIRHYGLLTTHDVWKVVSSSISLFDFTEPFPNVLKAPAKTKYLNKLNADTLTTHGIGNFTKNPRDHQGKQQ